MNFVFLFFMVSLSAVAADLKLKDYDWNLTDITSRGLTKEVLYSKMDRSFIKTKSSICSNRAHMWANDFKRLQQLDTAKIFIFYTERKSSLSAKTWWYHVAPVINEYGKPWVMDAGFGSWIKAPMTKEEWFTKFATVSNCKEIQAGENDLIQYIFNGQVFPRSTAYGQHECYYKIVPHTIWTPLILAQNLTGKDADGTPIRVDRPEIVKSELYEACLEAVSNKFEWATGANKDKCKAYVGY